MSDPTHARPGNEPTRPHVSGAPWGQAPATGEEFNLYRAPTHPQGEPPGPPPRGPRALLTALVATAAVLVVAIVAISVVLVTGGDDTDDRAGGATTEGTTEGTTPPAPGTATGSPSAPTSPTSPSSPSAPADPAPDGAFSYTEYGDDWDFRFGDVSLFAEFQQGWDHPDCGPVEVEGALTELGCQRASQWTYRALDGKLSLTHVVLTMPDAATATRVVEDELIAAEDWKADPATYVEGVDDGTWVARAAQEFVVLTLESHTVPVRQGTADRFRSYANTDIGLAIEWRD